MAVTLGGVDLGKIQQMSVSKSETISAIPKITKDSDETITVSISGALRTIKIKGILTSTTVAGLKTAYGNVEALIDGNQTAVVELVIDVEGTNLITKDVFINDFIWDYDVSERMVLGYSLNLVEGT